MENTRNIMVISALTTILLFVIAVIYYSNTGMFDPALAIMITLGTCIYGCSSMKYKEEIEEEENITKM